MHIFRFHSTVAKAILIALIWALASCTTQSTPLAQSSLTGSGTLFNNTTTACSSATGTLTMVSPVAVNGVLNVAIGQSVTWAISMSCAGSYSVTRNGTVISSSFSQYTTYNTTYSAAAATGSESVTVMSSTGQSIPLSSSSTFSVTGSTSNLSSCGIAVTPSLAVIGPQQPNAVFHVTVSANAAYQNGWNAGNTITSTNTSCNYVVQNVTAINQYQQSVPVTPAGNSGNGTFGVNVSTAGNILIQVLIADPSNANSSTTTTNTLTLSVPVVVETAPSCQLIPSATSLAAGATETFTLITNGPVGAAQIVGPVDLGQYPVAYPMPIAGGTQSIVMATQGNFTFEGQVRGSGQASNVVVNCPAPISVNAPAAPSCTLSSASIGGSNYNITLAPSSGSSSILHSYITSVNPNLDLGSAGGTETYSAASGSTTVYGQVTGPGGTGNCSLAVAGSSSGAQQTFTYPRCPNGYVLEMCSQSEANLYCQSQGYASALSITVLNGLQSGLTSTPCDCQIDSYYSGVLQYHVNGPTCDSTSNNRCNSITCTN